MPLRPAVIRWLARYGAAEVVGVCTALTGAWTMHTLSGSTILTAYGGSIGENVGYFGFLTARELAASRRAARASGVPHGARHVVVVFRELVIEFGPAELLDSAVIRPFMMALGTRWIGGALGILAGKLAADVLFYLPVIATYEARRPRRVSPPR